MTARPEQLRDEDHGPTSEIVGFLCRWLLLGGAGALIGLVAWESLLATVGVSQDVHARFVVVDSIARAGAKADGHCYQRGLLSGLGSPSGMAMALAARGAEPIKVVSHHRGDGFWVRWSGCRAGNVPVVYQGVPYSCLAFERQTARILGVPDGRAVTVVDVRLARAAARAQPETWRDTLAAQASLGDVALFFDGPADHYSAVLTEYRRSGGQLPVLLGHRPMPQLFARIARDLARGKGDGISIVTSDAALAGKVGQAGFAVFLIDPSAAANPASRGVVPHASLDRFKDSLPAPPIRH